MTVTPKQCHQARTEDGSTIWIHIGEVFEVSETVFVDESVGWNDALLRHKATKTIVHANARLIWLA